MTTARTSIEWTRGDDGTPGATWNPVTGCTKVSPGCDHCYAESIARRFAGTPAFPNGFAVTLRPERLTAPLRWQRPRRVFVNSMSDLYHQDVPDEFIAKVFAVMAATPQHTYQILTKRYARMRALLRDECRCGRGHLPGIHFRSAMSWAASAANPDRVPGLSERQVYHEAGWPLPNVHLGVSVEDQAHSERRVGALLETPAAVRFVSAEPLLGPLDLRRIATRRGVLDALTGDVIDPADGSVYAAAPASLDWVITGAESGPGARRMDTDWVRALRDQCVATGTAFFYKQDATPRGAKIPTPQLDGRTWTQMPAAVSA